MAPIPNVSDKELALLECVLRNAQPGSPESAIAAIDNFCWTPGQWCMCLGDEKGG